MIVQAVAILRKDLEIELRTRATAARTLPFAGILVILFAIALDPDRGVLERVAPGLFWIAMLLASLLAVGRSFAIEVEHRAGDGLLLAGCDPVAMFLGKWLAVTVELITLMVIVGTAMVAMYGLVDVNTPVVLVAGVLAGAGIAAAGVLYGAAVAGADAADSLLAVLLLPALVPVMVAATRACEIAIDQAAGSESTWLMLLAVFAVLHVGSGVLAFGTLVERW